MGFRGCGDAYTVPPETPGCCLPSCRKPQGKIPGRSQCWSILQDGLSLLRESLLHLRHPSSAKSRVGILLRDDRPEELLISVLEKAVLATSFLPARRGKIPGFLISLVESDLSGEAFCDREGLLWDSRQTSCVLRDFILKCNMLTE